MSAGIGKRGMAFKLAVAVCVLAVGVLFADPEIGYYAPETLGRVAQPAPPRLVPNAVYQVSAYPLYAPRLEPGVGRQEVEAYCNTCHSPNYISMQPPLPAATWAAEVHKMQKVMGMDIPADSQARILKYLETHYTPATRKR